MNSYERKYDDIGKFLCETYVKKNHLLEKKAEAQKKIADLMAENLPDLVKQASDAVEHTHTGIPRS